MEIAEKLEKKLLQKMERHNKHPVAEYAGSKTSSAETSDSKGKASGAAATKVSPGAASMNHASLPGLFIPPMDPESSSSTLSEEITGGITDVGSTDNGSSSFASRPKSKTAIPSIKQSPGFKQVRILESQLAATRSSTSLLGCLLLLIVSSLARS